MQLRVRVGSVIVASACSLGSATAWGQAGPRDLGVEVGPRNGRPWELPPTGPVTVPRPTAELRWYGRQNLLVDGLALALLPVEPSVSVGALMFGSAIIHQTHGRRGAAAASVALRVAIPAAIWVASPISPCGGDFCIPDPRPAFAAFLLGMLVDDLALSWEPVPTRSAPPTGLRVTPTLAVSSKGGFAGLVGSF